jgi:hypothetical protein
MPARPLRLLLVVVTAAMSLASVAPSATATGPGGVFVTGHDPDFHTLAGGNSPGARNIIRRAVEFVTGGHPSPHILLVSSAITPPAGHRSSIAGVHMVYPSITVAGAPDPVNLGAGLLDLSTVDFSAFDAVIVASDFGGVLRQAELDVLNARSPELLNYVNNGGGLVAFAESDSGARLTPAGGHFDFLPFLVSEVQLNQSEVGFSVTPFGLSLGLTNADVNGNASHNVFLNSGGMEVVNVDAGGRIMSLATRERICPGGVPEISIGDVAVLEGGAGDITVATFPVTLTVEPCGASVTVNFASADGTAIAGEDYTAVSGTLTFAEGAPLTRHVNVPVLGDATFEPDETFTVGLSDAENASIADATGEGTILNDDSPNRAPDCSSVSATPATLWPPKHDLRQISLAGATDEDGDAVTISVTSVTQDEPTNGLGDGDVSPDAAAAATSDSVLLRAERSGTGDGRVYRIAFEGTDPAGGACVGTVVVGVPRDMRGASAADSGGTFNSFTP